MKSANPDPCQDKVEQLGDKVAAEVEKAWTAPVEEANAARDEALVRISELVEEETTPEPDEGQPAHPARIDTGESSPAAR